MPPADLHAASSYAGSALGRIREGKERSPAGPAALNLCATQVIRVNVIWKAMQQHHRRTGSGA